MTRKLRTPTGIQSWLPNANVLQRALLRSLPLSLWLAFTASSGPAAAAALTVVVLAPDGRPPLGTVVTVRPAAAAAAARAAPVPARAVMDQVARAFEPEVLAVAVGTEVAFPNSDSVSHQVYSFSAAKRFQLPLYRGQAHPPVRFEQAGLVTLGCNIHDSMVGYILVTDAPWFGQITATGRFVVELPAGHYRVSIWHPRLQDAEPRLQQDVALEGDSAHELMFRLAATLRPAPLRGKPLSWDY